MSTVTNIEFSGKWLSKGKFEIESGELVWWQKKLEWKNIIIPQLVQKYYSVPIEDIAYAVPHKNIFKRILRPLYRYTKTLLGTKSENEDYCIPVKDRDVQPLFKLLEDNGAPAMSIIDKVITEKIENSTCIHNRKSVFSPVTLWVYPEVIIGTGIFGKSDVAQRVVCDQARFYCNSRTWRPLTFLPFIKLPKKCVYFGFLDQIYAVLSPKDAEFIKQHLIAHNAPFAREQHMCVKSSWSPDLLFKPNLWLIKERMATTDEAVIYQRHSFCGTEMMYVPYDDMSFVRIKPLLGVMPARLYMLGQQNIITHKKFSARQLKTLRKEFDKRMKKRFENGKFIGPSWLSRMSGNFSNSFMAISDEGIAIKGKSDESKTNKSFGFVPTNGIEEWCFVRKKWYSLVGTLWLSGDYGNIRKDQESHFSCYVKGIGIWHFKFLLLFSGSIYNNLMSTNRDAYISSRKDRKQIKYLVFQKKRNNKESKFNIKGSALGKNISSEIFKNINS